MENYKIHPEIGDKNFPEIVTLDDLISSLYEAFEEDVVNVEYVGNLMKAYQSNPKDWKKFAKFDQYRYTRNLIDAGNGKFNLMLLCWGENHGSAVHDHADSHCFMKMLQGSLAEVRFEWPKSKVEGQQSLKEISRCTLKTNEVCYINDSLGLHRVENMSHTNTAVSLHLYCPPFDECSMFDQRTGHRSNCKVTFWSKFGEKTVLSRHEQFSVSSPENN